VTVGEAPKECGVDLTRKEEKRKAGLDIDDSLFLACTSLCPTANRPVTLLVAQTPNE